MNILKGLEYEGGLLRLQVYCQIKPIRHGVVRITPEGYVFHKNGDVRLYGKHIYLLGGPVSCDTDVDWSSRASAVAVSRAFDWLEGVAL